MQVNPMTRDIYSHRQQEKEHVLRIKVCEHGTQTHSAASVRQLVQYRPELSALVKVSCCMPIKRI